MEPMECTYPLVYSSQRRFLWVELHLNNIIRLSLQTGTNIRQELKKLPRGLSATYESIFGSIFREDPYDRTLDIFRWTLGAQRPLHINELVHATAISIGQVVVREEDLPSQGIDLLDNCRNLIRINQSTMNVEFIHSTVEEFILSSSIFPHSWNPSRHLHYRLSRTALTYLMLDCFQKATPESWARIESGERDEVAMPDLWSALCINEKIWPDRAFNFRNGVRKREIVDLSVFYRSYPFLRYASLYWPRHFCLSDLVDNEASNQLSEELTRHISDFVQSTASETWVMVNAALEARIRTIGFNLTVVSRAFHHGYTGTDISPRKERFEDFEQYMAKNGQRSSTISESGIFNQRLSMFFDLHEYLKLNYPAGAPNE
jgi:hypothetical protein